MMISPKTQKNHPHHHPPFSSPPPSFPGQVPTVLYVEDHTVHAIPESGVLLEFLEDYKPSPPLLPPHPASRAAARLLVRRIDDKFVPPFYKLLRG